MTAILSSSSMTTLLQQFTHRANLHVAITRRWDFCCQLDGFIQVMGLDQEVARQLVASLDKWPICYRELTAAHLDKGGRFVGLQRLGTQEVSAAHQFLIVC